MLLKATNPLVRLLCALPFRLLSIQPARVGLDTTSYVVLRLTAPVSETYLQWKANR